MNIVSPEVQILEVHFVISRKYHVTKRCEGQLLKTTRNDISSRETIFLQGGGVEASLSDRPKCFTIAIDVFDTAESVDILECLHLLELRR